MTSRNNLLGESQTPNCPTAKPKADSRLDIQGLRTVAITAVFVFHLWPKIFANGFLGVDMFFVISGYLMAQILSKYDRISLRNIGNFYQRRIRRIVPIFLLAICFVVYSGSFILTEEDFDVLCQDAVPALTFTTNLRTLLEKDDYWAQVFTYRILLHTWSLGVEIQFYLLVPLIFYFLLKLKNRHHQCLASTAIAFASLALQFFSTQTVAFNLVFARMWQFFAGILAFFSTATMCDDLQTHSDTIGDDDAIIRASWKKRFVCTTQLFLLISVMFLPMPILPHILKQMIVVASTACILGLGSPKISVRMFVLENWLFVKLGDWSYVWYLVHWPIIEFWLYWSPDGVMHITDSAIITALIILIVLIFDFIDVQLRQIVHFYSVASLICFMYLFLLAFIFHEKRFGSEKMVSTVAIADANYTRWYIEKLTLSHGREKVAMLKSLSLDAKISMNKNIKTISSSKYQCLKHELTASQECVFQGNGTMQALLVGNSHALYAFRAIASTFSMHFKKLRLIWRNGCMPVHVFTKENPIKSCRAFAETVVKTVERDKPDILFLQFMWRRDMELPIANRIAEDAIFLALNKDLKTLQLYTKLIYIGEPNLFFRYPVALELAKRLRQGLPLNVLDKNVTTHKDSWRHSYERLRQLECLKCVLIPWTEAFCDSKTGFCQPFDSDSQLAYFFDEHHWSLLGRFQTIPLLQRLSDQLILKNGSITKNF